MSDRRAADTVSAGQVVRCPAGGPHILGGLLHGDGNGWIHCAQGHQHWGRHGAAGLLVRRTADGDWAVLMQHRAGWTSNGGTWGLPGGARDSQESWATAALREAFEEAGIEPADVSIADEWHDDHGGWAYVTVIADALRPLTVTPNAESAELRWVAANRIDALALHPGFALTWPRLHADFLTSTEPVGSNDSSAAKQ